MIFLYVHSNLVVLFDDVIPNIYLIFLIHVTIVLRSRPCTLSFGPFSSLSGAVSMFSSMFEVHEERIDVKDR